MQAFFRQLPWNTKFLWQINPCAVSIAGYILSFSAAFHCPCWNYLLDSSDWASAMKKPILAWVGFVFSCTFELCSPQSVPALCQSTLCNCCSQVCAQGHDHQPLQPGAASLSPWVRSAGKTNQDKLKEAEITGDRLCNLDSSGKWATDVYCG